MAKLTFLEVHLEDSTFTANAPFSPDAELSEGESEDEESTDESDSGRPWLAAIVGLLFLAVLAVLVRRTLGGEDEIPGVEAE